MDVVTLEHSNNTEVLIQGTTEVAFPLASHTQHFIEDLKALFLNLNGVGLAAPQVGSSQNIFVYRITAEQNSLRKDASRVVPTTVLINAYYEPTRDAQIVYDWEACFSVVEHTGKVPRYSKIHYHAVTPFGEPIDAIAEGFEARVLQHEIDHLQGILITHRLSDDCMQGKPDEMLALRYQEFTPEQKRIAKKLLIDREKNTPSTDTTSLEYIHKALRILENE